MIYAYRNQGNAHEQANQRREKYLANSTHTQSINPTAWTRSAVHAQVNSDIWTPPLRFYFAPPGDHIKTTQHPHP